MLLVSRTALGCGLLLVCSVPSFASYRLVHVAGQPDSGYSGDGDAATAARLNRPAALAVAPDGTLYVADTGNHRIRKIPPDGIISTVAGNGTAGTSGDGGPAIAAALDTPSDLAVDALGSLYIVTASGLRRVDAGDGRISTLFGFASWRYAVANDALGNVFFVVAPFTNATTYGPHTQPYVAMISASACDPPSFAPIIVQGIDWNATTVSRFAAGDPQHAVLTFDRDQVDYGIATVGGRVVLSTNEELYALNRPAGIGVGRAGALYLSGGSYYTGNHQYVMQRQGSGFASVAGGGSDSVRDGALADTAELSPRALAVAGDDLIYFVQAPSQVYGLRREATRPGLIAGRLASVPAPQLVTVLAAGDDGTVRYAQPNRRGYFRFPDLAPGAYRVYAHYDEEGLSCDANNCGWSGAADDCPRTLNDPVVQITPEEPVSHVRLRMLRTFPCL